MEALGQLRDHAPRLHSQDEAAGHEELVGIMDK